MFLDTVKSTPTGGVLYAPHPYQSDCTNHLLEHAEAGLFLPPGLGKTAIVLDTFKKLRKQGVVNQLLVIAPIRVCHMVWPNEIAKWQQFSDLKISIVHGPKKKEALDAEADVYVINPDGLQWLFKHTAKFNKTWMIVVDESSNFKNGRSARFRLLKQMVQLFGRRVIMTGNPAPNGLRNLWSQIYLLDSGQRLGRFVTHFFNRFFYASGYMGYEKTIQPGADLIIYKLIEDIVLHKSRDLLDMPGLLEHHIVVPLPDDARQVYDSMKREMVADVEGEEITAVNAAVKVGKLQQLSNGAVYGAEGAIRHIHSAKIEALMELHEELEGRPLLVYYGYLHDLNQLQTAFPKAPSLGGHTTHKEAEKNINEWNRGEIPIMFLHPASAGRGLNLQAGGCQDVCFFNITFDLELVEQAIARVWRQGIKSGVTAHYLIGENTIDEMIMRVLAKKSTVQQALMEALQ